MTSEASPIPVSLIMVQFLAWISERDRSYAETMEAWRTSCPRLSVWEDATLEGLVRLDADTDRRTLVHLTARGRAAPATAAAQETSKINPNHVTQGA
jgi:hypothetical protein